MTTQAARSKARTRWQYALDTPTTLLARRRGASAGPVTRLDGSFMVGAGNRIEFQLSPAARGMPPEHPALIRIDGTWRLRDDRTLIFTAHQSTLFHRSRVALRGGLARADAHRLVFAIERDTGGEPSQDVTLTGRWTVAPGNRLRFLARRSDGSDSPLTLQGAWEIGDRHEVRYRVASRLSARGIDRVSALSFAGAWNIPGPRRIRYELLGASDSSFEFEAALRTPSVVARDGALLYDAGVRVARGRTRRVRIALFGAWKFGRNRAIEFEVPYASGRVQAIRLTAKTAIARRAGVELALASARGERLEFSLILARDLSKDAKLFLRATQHGDRREVLGGIQVRF